MKKRLISILLLAVLLLTMLPVCGLAEEPGEGGDTAPVDPEPAPAEDPVEPEDPAEPEPPEEPETPAETETPADPQPAGEQPRTETAAAPAADDGDEAEKEPGNIWGIPAEDVIWYGFYDDGPVAWLVLDDGQTNMGTEGVFLLSRGLIDKGKVMHDKSSTLWEGSMSQQWCTDFAGTAFSQGESALVLPTSKHDDFAHLFLLDWSEMDLKEEQVFFPSAEEMALYFGSTSGDSYVTIKDSSLEKYYWLRSTPAIHYGYHGMVLSQNTVHDYEPDHHYSARPCMNLSLQDAVWVLPASDEGLPGAVSIPEREEGAALEWKLIVPLQEHSFGLDSVAAEDSRLTLRYSGADTGEKAMLSLLARDQDGMPLGLWRLEQPAAAQGELEVDLQTLNLPQDAELFLFCEELNEPCRSNYASPLQQITLPEEEEPTEPQEPVVTPGDEESTGTIAPVTPTSQRRTDKGRTMGTAGKIIMAVLLGLLALGLVMASVRRQSIIPLVLLILVLLLAAVVDLRAGLGFFPGL